MSRQPLTDKDGEVRELTPEDFKHMHPASDVLPKEVLSVLPKRGRPRKKNPKKQVTLRLDPEILSFFKTQGTGWQTAINAVLKDHIKGRQL
jgi:uncharacterized protein (DUF4415 family)